MFASVAVLEDVANVERGEVGFAPEAWLATTQTSTQTLDVGSEMRVEYCGHSDSIQYETTSEDIREVSLVARRA